MNNLVQVTRGGVVESHHRVHVAVAHAERGLVAWTGEPQYVSFVRSAIKMFQALPLAEDGVTTALGLTNEEIALCTASHNAEPFHVDAAQRILHKARTDEAHLACGPHAPMGDQAARDLEIRGIAPGRIHNNCSGKHAGMLALATHHGWPLSGYHLPEHPVQQRVRDTLSRWSSFAADRFSVGVDGCGLPTFALPLSHVAQACARFASAADAGEPARLIASAMTSHPDYVAGTGRLCTHVMRESAGRLFAKVGAEGFYCAGIPAMGLGVALKVEDGARRAAEVALVEVLRSIDALTAAECNRLTAWSRPTVLNTLGAEVGEIHADIWLST